MHFEQDRLSSRSVFCSLAITIIVHRTQLHACLLCRQVKYAMARDVRLEELGSMIDKLGNWASTTQVLLATLEVCRRSQNSFVRGACSPCVSVGRSGCGELRKVAAATPYRQY